MARIEPIPWDELSDEARAMLAAGSASGMYTTTVPMQVIAYSTPALRAIHDAYTATWQRTSLEPRLVELMRLYSAQLGSCEPCSASRKDESVTEEDVACLLSPDPQRLNPREYAALRFFEQFAADHHAIDDEAFRSLHEVFSTAEVIEVGYLCANGLGMHRLFHTLGLFSDAPPAIAYDAAEVDASRAPIDHAL